MNAAAKTAEPTRKPSDTSALKRRAPSGGGPASAPGLLDSTRAQQTAGNLAVQRLLRAGVLRPRLNVGSPGDPDEQEADRVAKRVVSSAPAGVVRRECAACAGGASCSKCEDERLRAKAEPGRGARVSSAQAPPAATLRGGGRPLSPSLRAFFEPRFGHDFRRVRVHTDGAAAETARAINARAYTSGQDVVFAAGEYAPESAGGRELLAHELTHVVQNGLAPASARPPIRRQPFGGAPQPPTPDAPLGQQAWGQLAGGMPNYRFGFPAQEEDPHSLRFTDRSFPTAGQARLSCPKQACHASSDKLGLTVPPDRRVTMPRLLAWALKVGLRSLLTEPRLVQLQLKPGSEGELVQQVGNDLLRSVLASHEFEGPPQARADAAEGLAMAWGDIGPQLRERLSSWFRAKFAEAIQHTLPGAEIVSDELEYRRVLTNPHGGLMPTGRWNQMARVGERYGVMQIEAIGMVTVWFSLVGRPQWFYSMSGTSFVEWDPFVAGFAQETADRTKFAAELFPLMIKAGAFGLGLSSNIAFVVAGIVLSNFAEEWQRDLRGQPGRSWGEIVKGGFRELLIDRITNRVLGPGGRVEGKGMAGDAAAAAVSAEGRALVDAVEGPAAAAVRSHIVDTEAPKVARALSDRGARKVEDPALRGEGYLIEVEVIQYGERHIYRQLGNGRWCRFSAVICDLELGGAVEEAARSASEKGLAGVRETMTALRTDQSHIVRAYYRLAKAPTRGGRIDATLLHPDERAVLDEIAPGEDAANLTIGELKRLARRDVDKLPEYAALQAQERALIARIADEARPMADKLRALLRDNVEASVLRESRGLDAVNGASPRTGKLSVEHIVPVREMAELPGVNKLNPDELIELANDRKNLMAMDLFANSTRQNRHWADLPREVTRRLGYSDKAVADMAKLQDEVRAHLVGRIATMLSRRGRH